MEGAVDGIPKAGAADWPNAGPVGCDDPKGAPEVCPKVNVDEAGAVVAGWPKEKAGIELAAVLDAAGVDWPKLNVVVGAPSDDVAPAPKEGAADPNAGVWAPKGPVTAGCCPNIPEGVLVAGAEEAVDPKGPPKAGKTGAGKLSDDTMLSLLDA
jgi:hypothetical protein